MFNANTIHLIVQFPDRKNKRKWIFEWKWISETRTFPFSMASYLTVLTYFISDFKTREKLDKSIFMCSTFSAA